MENQHRKISGYRELSQAEIDLMNEIKALGPLIQAIVLKVEGHIEAQQNVAEGGKPEAWFMWEHLQAAEPGRFAALAKSQLQTGLMLLTRAVAQPTFF